MSIESGRTTGAAEGAAALAALTSALRRLAELTGLEIDLRPLDARTESYTTRVDAGLASRPDVQAVVDRIDQEQAASTDDLVSEIELFLRSQDDE